MIPGPDGADIVVCRPLAVRVLGDELRAQIARRPVASEHGRVQLVASGAAAVTLQEPWVGEDQCPTGYNESVCRFGDRIVSTKPVSDPRLNEVVRRLIEAYAPERIYLFGSQARDEAGPDSDFDLLLVVPDEVPADRKRSRLAYEVLWGTGMSVDVLVWPKSRFDARVHLPASLPGTVVREGTLLHAA